MISAKRIDEMTASAKPPQGICAPMVRGLHAAAQPLTTLLAGLSHENTEAMQAGELHELVSASAVEVQRVCTLFHCLQQLLVAESVPPEMTLNSMTAIVQHVTEGIQLLFEHDGMRLQCVVPDVCPPVILDRARTMQALCNVLCAAHAVSRKSATVQMVVSCVGKQVLRIVVHNGDESLDALAAGKEVELELIMAVAEANLRCQHGRLSWSLRPFHADMQLRLLPLAGAEK